MKKYILLFFISLSSFSFDLVDYYYTWQETADHHITSLELYNNKLVEYLEAVEIAKDAGLPLEKTDFIDMGSKLSHCAHKDLCNKRRSEGFVIPRMEKIILEGKTPEKFVLTNPILDQVMSDAYAYYAAFDPSIEGEIDILFESDRDLCVFGTGEDYYLETEFDGIFSEDLEDIATEFRVARDGYLAAANQAKLSIPAYFAAQAAAAEATKVYYKNLGCSKWANDVTPDNIISQVNGAL